jgi:hypothetical protein
MMTKRSFVFASLLIFALLFIPAGSVPAIDNDSAIIHKTFTLHQSSKGDPFTIFYPIELTRPGEIKVYARVDNLDPKLKSNRFEPLRLIIVDARAFKKMKPSQWKQWLRKANKFNPAEWVAGDAIRKFVNGVKRVFGKKKKKPSYYHGQIACGREGKGESIKHAVDSPELRKTEGRYVIIFRNIARLKATGQILITYPGENWELDREVEKQFKVHPDLVVKDLALNENNQLVVTVVNRGPGALHLVKWHDKGREAVSMIVKAGARGYGVTLPALDPEYKLRHPNGAVSYTFEKVILKKTTKVDATIDKGNKVIESNEGNNRLIKNLGPSSAGLKPKPMSVQTGQPDLMVSSIRLDNRKRVIITVKNIGTAGLDPSLWTAGSQNAPQLHLKMNDNGWAMISLKGLDPRKRLSRAGGVARYNTKYVLRQSVLIDATIDVTNVVNESNETNNTLSKTIAP